MPLQNLQHSNNLLEKSVMVLHEKGAKHVKNCEAGVKQEKPIQAYFGASAEKTKLKV